MGLNEISRMCEQAIVTAVVKKSAAKTSLSPAMEQAKRFLTNKGDKLLGVRGNVAVVQNFGRNKDVFMTSFYDITKQLEKDAWLKTKYVTKGKLTYLPFGPRSFDYHFVKNAVSGRQRKDIMPSKTSKPWEYNIITNTCTKYYNKFQQMIDKIQVINVGKRSKPVEDTVFSRIKNKECKYYDGFDGELFLKCLKLIR